MRWILLILGLFALPPMVAQNAAEGKDTIEQVYYAELDGVVVKITVRGNPKAMNKILTKEIKIRRELINIHQEMAKIHESLGVIYRELNLRCPKFEKIMQKRRQCNQKALKHQQKKLKCAQKLRNSLKQKQSEPQKQEVDDANAKALYEKLDKALDEKIESQAPPVEAPQPGGESPAAPPTEVPLEETPQ